jgi:D-serine deaminase-like pyridoxal phosphate-dependent protein
MLNLTSPTLLLDEKKCLTNIMTMVEKARRHKVVFRPHFKTHQSHEVGRWFRNLGVTRITVSSMKMAEYFANDGWSDITVAFPVNIHEKERINRLAKKIKLSLLITSPQSVDLLGTTVTQHVDLFIEVDTGQHRTGVNPTDTRTIDDILSRMSHYPRFRFAGFLSHGGHSYKVTGDKNELKQLLKEGIGRMRTLKEKYNADYPDLIISPGDTPTCSVADSFEGADEIRPGNFVFYDYGQYHIGSCSVDQIAVALACPVVAVYPDREIVAVHGGAVHLSRDSMTLPDDTAIFGKVVRLTIDGWDTSETGMYVKSISQEHGIIHAEKLIAEKIKIGDWLGVLPVHSCLTADVMKAYSTLAGETISMMR